MEISDRIFGKVKISKKGRVAFPAEAYRLVMALSNGDLMAGYQEHEKAFVFYFQDKFCEIAQKFRAYDPNFQRIFTASHYNTSFRGNRRISINNLPKIKENYGKCALLSWSNKKEKFILKPL